MRIGVLTYHFAMNYGAVLQAYALTRFLREQGHDVKLIDYVRAEKQNLLRYTLTVVFTVLRRDPFRAVQFLYGRFKRHLEKDERQQKEKMLQKQKLFSDVFVRFRNKHFVLTEKTYKSLDDLRADPPEMDAYIVGSDQVWNPKTIFSQAYFLDFGKPETLRIAYAPSFGQATLEKLRYSELRRNLERFDAISVRERSGVRIVNEVGYKATYVVDPTLLIDDYSSITHIDSSDEFIFVYRLHQNQRLSKAFDGILERLSERYNLKIKTVAPMSESLLPGEDIIAEVEDFLGLIASCRIMITNSFHGVIFAILHKKNFICFPRTEEDGGQNERMLDLLDNLGLHERYFDIDRQFDPLEIINSEIDWDSVTQKLVVLRRASVKFLTDALSMKRPGVQEI